MRKGQAEKRVILPDPKFLDLNIAKLINMIM
jgi:ribosomal protein S7